MSIARVLPADLRLSVDPAALGFAETAELLQETLPWIGQARAEQAARFGLQMAQPDDHLFVLGEVGSGRASLLGEMMAREAASRPVPPDFKADCERIEADHQSEEEQAFATLSALAEARNFGLIREQGRMVFTDRAALHPHGGALLQHVGLDHVHRAPRDRGLRPRLHDVERAVRAVLGPLDVHRPPAAGTAGVVGLDLERGVRECQHVGVAQAEPDAVGWLTTGARVSPPLYTMRICLRPRRRRSTQR